MFPETPAAASALSVATRFYSPALLNHWRPEKFPPDVRTEMLARYPRQGFGTEFLACFEDQARRKPGSAAAASVGKDVAGRIAANPLEGHPPA